MSALDFESFAYYQQVAHYTEFACLTALLYDYLIFADQEAEHFWHFQRGKALGQFFYFANRYFLVVYLVLEIFGRNSQFVNDGVIVRGLWFRILFALDIHLSLISVPFSCQAFHHHLQSLLPIMQTFFAEAAFTYRLLVVLHWQKIFLYTVAPLCLVCNFISLVVSQPPLQSLDVAAVAPWGTPGCIIVGYRTAVYTNPIFAMTPILFYSTVLLGLTIWVTSKQITSSPYNHSVFVVLLGTIRRQSIMFYVVAVSTVIINLTVFHKAPLLFITFTPITSLVLSMLSTRLTIQMKDEAWMVGPENIELLGQISTQRGPIAPSSQTLPISLPPTIPPALPTSPFGCLFSHFRLSTYSR